MAGVGAGTVARFNKVMDFEDEEFKKSEEGKTMENTTLERKTIFISYCHKDTTEEWIDKLATALGQYGINSIVDIYDLQLGQDLNYFMEQIKKVDKVLILLGKTYMEKANDRAGGVGTETQIISADVYKDVEQTKFIPIVINKDEQGNAYIPYYLETRLYTDFSNDSFFAQNIEGLVRHIHKLPKKPKPIVVDPPKSLIQQNGSLSSLMIIGKLNMDELAFAILQEMESMKCTTNEYREESDDAIVRKIEESKEIRDFFMKSFIKMLDDDSVVAEDIIDFLEKAYCVADSYEKGTYYEVQNDGCRFFLHEIIIYIVAILYKKKKFKMISQLIKTTYFPNLPKRFPREGIYLSDFYCSLTSLENRNTRLKLNRKSLRADLLMQRATIKEINFEEIRFADNLILMLSEWYFKRDNNYIYWYPVTIVYSSYSGDDCLELKKYLISKSRYEVIYELFGINSQFEFTDRYNVLAELLKDENRRGDFCKIPSICSIVKPYELFSKA